MNILRRQLKDGDEQLTEEQLIDRVRDLARGYYQKLWASCSKAERLTLIHLAEGNLVNPRNTGPVSLLLRRGLIRREPDLQIVSQSFAQYVLAAEPPERVDEWEHGTHDSTWSFLRIPLRLVLVLIFLFLSYSGHEAFSATVSLIATALAAIPVLFQALNVFRGSQGPQSTGGGGNGG